MSDLFDVNKPDLDIGFENLKNPRSQVERDLKAILQSMWERFEPYADNDFRDGFARHFEARFWEMYLANILLDAGRELLRRSQRAKRGGRPDLCVLDQGRRIWIEAIAPTEGQPGPDQVVGPVPLNEGGRFSAMPIRQAHLRMTSAFGEKARAIQRYLDSGVISPHDVRIIAISASRFGAYVPDQPVPLILSSLFPIGDEVVTLDRDTGQVVSRGFHHSPLIHREGASIERDAFLAPCNSHISGVIWSRIGIGNLHRHQRPITYVHNPLAQVPLPNRWSVWDREYLTSIDGSDWECRDILAAP